MKPKERLLIRRPLVRAHVEEPNKQKPSELIALKAFFTFYPTDNAWRLNATITYEFEWGGLQITIWEGWGMQDSQQEKSYCGRLLKRIEKNK